MNKHGFPGVRKRTDYAFRRRPYYARISNGLNNFIYSKNVETAEQASEEYKRMKMEKGRVQRTAEGSMRPGEITDYFIGCVVAAFDSGVNTADMAKRCSPARSEADFERALHIGLERRRADRQAGELAEAVGRLADELGANV